MYKTTEIAASLETGKYKMHLIISNRLIQVSVSTRLNDQH
jgi:hypothetical protein